MPEYTSLPGGARGTFEKIQVHFPPEKLDQMKSLIKSSPIGPATFENTSQETIYGVTRDWLTNTKKFWLGDFDWYQHESAINEFPHYKTRIRDEDDGTEHDIHFMALFSEKENAIPIAFLHGWPGSFLEFLGVFKYMKEKYTPATLPYHLIAPSLVGYALSAGPPTHRHWGVDDTARVVHALMLNLNFHAYAVQGGDVGSGVARVMGVRYEECKAVHLNMDTTGKPDGVGENELADVERQALLDGHEWKKTETAYALEHGTKPNTIGFVISSSPVALLCWIGEKFLTWPDEPIPLDVILRTVTLYWLTETFSRSIYPYRLFAKFLDNTQRNDFIKSPGYYISKPTGYSWFPKELAPIPRAWVARSANLQWSKMHKRGGHFAALERPQDLAKDVEDFLNECWVNT